MSLAARLFIDPDTKGIKITACDFSFSQDVDNKGQMSSKVRAGLVHVTLPGTADTDLLDWMVRDSLKKCTIKFSGFVDTGQPRSIEFENAALVGYHESFSEPMDTVINLTITYETIKIKGGVVKSMNWNLASPK